MLTCQTAKKRRHRPLNIFKKGRKKKTKNSTTQEQAFNIMNACMSKTLCPRAHGRKKKYKNKNPFLATLKQRIEFTLKQKMLNMRHCQQQQR